MYTLKKRYKKMKYLKQKQLVKRFLWIENKEKVYLETLTYLLTDHVKNYCLARPFF